MNEENKNLIPEDVEEATSDQETNASQETEVEIVEVEVEETEEITEESKQEEQAEQEETDETDVPEATEVPGEEVLEPEEKKVITKPIIAGIVCVVIIVAALIVLAVKKDDWFNKYNRNQIDITGKTIGEIADEAGYDYADFLHAMQLPMDLPENTYEQAAFYSMPFKAYLENYYGITEEEDLKDFKEYNELDLEITEETTLGEVFDVMMLKYYVGEENLETFKQEYGFGDDVTAETKYGEIRRKVEEHDRDKRIKEEQAKEDESSLVEPEAEAEAEADAGTESEMENAMDDAATAEAVKQEAEESKTAE